jgi:hypothetical protein
MSENPQKRLVSMGQYLHITLTKHGIYTLGSVIRLTGFLVLPLLYTPPALPFFTALFRDNSLLRWAVLPIYVGFIYTSFTIADKVQNAAKKIETVAPITRHNTGDLPIVETLVRASNLPPSIQQAELLRAAQYGKDTPAEELLRATTRG